MGKETKSTVKSANYQKEPTANQTQTKSDKRDKRAGQNQNINITPINYVMLLPDGQGTKLK